MVPSPTGKISERIENMKLYFVRHGESEANVQRIISNRDLAHGLTEKGRQQAHSLAESLRDAGITALYSSPIPRAAQTAEIVGQALGLEIQTRDALREPDCGVAEGRGDPEAWQLNTNLWNDWQFRLRWDNHIPGGESFNDVQQRFLPFVADLLSESQNSGKNLALIGHGMLYYTMLPLILVNISRQFAGGLGFPNTAYVLAESGPTGLTCLEWCGVAVA
jgi:probable phosphoglycerate mutase